MFYLPIFPLGALISLLGFILAYFLEKYNFTHKYKRPEMLNEKLGEIHFNFFISVQILYSIGNYIFFNDLIKDDYWKIANIIIFCILAIIPYTKPISYYFNCSSDFKINSESFNNIYFSFCTDYQRQNPFTKKEGLYFYINKLKNNGYISDFLYEIIINNIEKINIMSIYYNSSMNRNLRESRSLLMRNKRKYNLKNLKESIKAIISEKEKVLHDSINIRKSKKIKDSRLNNEENCQNIISNSVKNSFDKKNISEIEKENKINIEQYKNPPNNIINDNLSLDYKFPLLVNIGLEIDNLTKENFSEDNNEENKRLDTIYSEIEEENNSEESEINLK